MCLPEYVKSANFVTFPHFISKLFDISHKFQAKVGRGLLIGHFMSSFPRVWNVSFFRMYVFCVKEALQFISQYTCTNHCKTSGQDWQFRGTRVSGIGRRFKTRQPMTSQIIILIHQRWQLERDLFFVGSLINTLNFVILQTNIACSCSFKPSLNQKSK